MSEQHFGMPGPGGSMGQCAVCGDTFIGGMVKNLVGLDSGIQSFTVGFVEGTLYCHAPKCKDKLAEAFGVAQQATDMLEGNRLCRDALPQGPLRKCIADAIAAAEAGSSDDE